MKKKSSGKKGKQGAFYYITHHLIRGLTRETVTSINLQNNALLFSFTNEETHQFIINSPMRKFDTEMLSNLSVVTQLVSLDFNQGKSHTKADTQSHWPVMKMAYKGDKGDGYSAKHHHTDGFCQLPQESCHS